MLYIIIIIIIIILGQTAKVTTNPIVTTDRDETNKATEKYATNHSNPMHALIMKTIGADKWNATTTCIEDKDGNNYH